MSLENSDSSRLLGIVVGDTKPHRFQFLARRAVSMGEYVTVASPAGSLLGLAEDSTTKSDLLGKVNNFQTALEARAVAARNTRDKSYVATVKVVGLLEELRSGKSGPSSSLRSSGAKFFRPIRAR